MILNASFILNRKSFSLKSLLFVPNQIWYRFSMRSQPFERTPFFYYSKWCTGGRYTHSPGISTPNILEFASRIALVKWWRLVMSLTGSRDWYVRHLQTKNGVLMAPSKLKMTSSINFFCHIYFEKFQGLSMSLTWETKKLF